MQRLFSTFANGWPGKALLIQRLVTGGALFCAAIAALEKDSLVLSTAPHVVAAAAGLFLALGLWTPVAGTLIAAIEIWIAFARPEALWIPVLLATFGGTLAMIGPGAWSVDAKLFGRQHFQTPHD